MFDSIYRANCKKYCYDPKNVDYYSCVYNTVNEYLSTIFASKIVPQYNFVGTITLGPVTSAYTGLGYIQGYQIIIDTATLKLALLDGETFLYNFFRVIGNSISMSILDLAVTGYPILPTNLVYSFESIALAKAAEIKAVKISNFDMFVSILSSKVESMIDSLIFTPVYSGTNGSSINGIMTVTL